MAMKQRQTRVVGNEVDLRLLIASQHHDILENSGCGLSKDFREFEAVAVQMDGMDVIAGIAHAYAIPLALLEVKGGRSDFAGHRKSDAIDGPAIEALFSGVVLYDDHLKSFI